MKAIDEAFNELKKNSAGWGVYLRPPLPEPRLEEWLTNVKAQLQMEVPADYVRLLELSNGLQSQQGSIHNADSFLEENYRRWFCETVSKSTPEGLEVSYLPLDSPNSPTYASLGLYGNLDEYIFDYRSRKFCVVNVFDSEEVNFSSNELGELLLYIAKGN